MGAPTLGALPDYAELQWASNFSFLRGASNAEQLAERAAQLGYSAFAVTDECSIAGVVRAHVEAKMAGMGYTHFLTRRFANVSTEMSLHVPAYNLKRVMAILGFSKTMKAMRLVGA